MLFFEFHAQAPDVNVDRALVAIEIVSPHALEQRVARECDAGTRDKRKQKRVFAWFEADVMTIDTRFARALIDLEAPEAQQLWTGFVTHSRTTQDRADARDDLAWRKRFDDVVIGAELESDDAIDFVGSRRDHDERCLETLTAQRASDIESVDPGKADIEKREVDAISARAKSSEAVSRFDRHEAVPFEVMNQKIADGAIVFGYKDADAAHVGLSARSRHFGTRTIAVTSC